jgi:hypothetical protein
MPNGPDQPPQPRGVSSQIPDHLADLRVQPVQPESTWQTIKRNLTPQIDTSRSARGPGQQFSSEDSPQQAGEQQYRETFGSPLEKAYGKFKGILAQHEQHFSDRVLKPFRESLDAMSDDLQDAAQTGHTRTGGQLTPLTRGVVGATGWLMKQVPVGSNVKETLAANIIPPELGPEGKALSQELKVAKKLPPQPRLPDRGNYAAIKTDDGSIYHDANPEKQRTHIMLAQDLGIPPERVVSGGWLNDGEYEGSPRSDAGRWGEQARAQAAVTGKRTSSQPATETLYHGSPDVSKIDSLKPGNKGGYFGDGIYLTRDPEVAKRFTKLESMNPTLERNADGSFTDINTGKRTPAGKPGVLETTLKGARLKSMTIEEMEAEVEKFRQPNGVIDLDAARNAVASKYAKQGYDGFDVSASKHFDEPQVVIFPSSKEKLSLNPDAVARNRPEIAKDNISRAKKLGIETTPEGNLILYHGTKSGDVIRSSGSIKQGSYLAADEKTARQYAEGAAGPEAKTEVMRVEVPAGTVLGNGDYFSANEAIPYKAAQATRTPEAKARERQLNLKRVGIGLTEMDPADARNWVGYTGKEKARKVYRGVEDPTHAIEAGDFVTTSKQSAQNYGRHVQEINVSPEELRYVRGHKNGDPKLLDQGGQTELIYAPKSATKAINQKATEALGKSAPKPKTPKGTPIAWAPPQSFRNGLPIAVGA